MSRTPGRMATTTLRRPVTVGKRLPRRSPDELVRPVDPVTPLRTEVTDYVHREQLAAMINFWDKIKD